MKSRPHPENHAEEPATRPQDFQQNDPNALAAPESAKTEPTVSRREPAPPVTRAGVLWTATIAGLLFLVLLIVLIAQNQDQVVLRYFAYEGNVPLGLALFIAAVSGGILVAAAGAARIMQLRSSERRQRRLGRK
jgi:uncharacterized integral membrane protein